MKTKQVIVAALACALILPSSFTLAAEQTTERQRIQTEDQEQIYGSQMMTEQERNEYRTRMHAAKTNAEREQIRMEHHERMTNRAKTQGMSMPETPPAKGSGMMPGSSHGGGMGGMGGMDGMGGGKSKKK